MLGTVAILRVTARGSDDVAHALVQALEGAGGGRGHRTRGRCRQGPGLPFDPSRVRTRACRGIARNMGTALDTSHAVARRAESHAVPLGVRTQRPAERVPA